MIPDLVDRFDYHQVKESTRTGQVFVVCPRNQLYLHGRSDENLQNAMAESIKNERTNLKGVRDELQALVDADKDGPYGNQLVN